MKYSLKRMGVISMMKMYGLIGLIFGLLYGLIMVPLLLFAGAAAGDSGMMGAGAGLVVVVVVAVAMPIIFAIEGAIMAIVYNLVAKLAGGVEIELVEKK